MLGDENAQNPLLIGGQGLVLIPALALTLSRRYPTPKLNAYRSLPPSASLDNTRHRLSSLYWTTLTIVSTWQWGEVLSLRTVMNSLRSVTWPVYRQRGLLLRLLVCFTFKVNCSKGSSPSYKTSYRRLQWCTNVSINLKIMYNAFNDKASLCNASSRLLPLTLSKVQFLDCRIVESRALFQAEVFLYADWSSVLEV